MDHPKRPFFVWYKLVQDFSQPPAAHKSSIESSWKNPGPPVDQKQSPKTDPETLRIPRVRLGRLGNIRGITNPP